MTHKVTVKLNLPLLNLIPRFRVVYTFGEILNYHYIQCDMGIIGEDAVYSK